MKAARSQLTVFSIGFFGLLAQTLLFRVFMTVFQGNELSTGIFFCSWLTWLIVGAFIGWLPFVNKLVVRCFDFCLLIYLPAFVLQQHLLFNARSVLGVAEYELIPFQQLAFAAGVFNAPVSIVTGLLLVTGASWLRQMPLPTARVYILDAFGSFAGAAIVTLLLYCRIPDAAIFPLAGAGLCFIPLVNNFTPGGFRAGLRSVAALACAILGLGMIAVAVGGETVQQQRNLGQWRRMLPTGRFMGSFATSQARYLFGEYRDEFTIIRWDGVCENFPERENAIETVASSLAQNPEARNILVVGSGAMSLCLEFCRTTQVESVVWMDADPDYPATVSALIAENQQEKQAKLITPRADIRAWLRRGDRNYDLVLLLLPPPSDLAMNRYFSQDFFKMLKAALTADGIIGVNFPGGENFISPELRLLGGSLLQTLTAEFADVVLKPGESARFYVSNRNGQLSVCPDELEARLARFPGLTRSFPPENFHTVFSPFRMDFQMDTYRQAISDEQTVTGSDQRPLLTRFALQQLLRRTGGGDFISRLEKIYGYVSLIGIGLVVLVVSKRILLGILRGKSPSVSPSQMPGSDIIFVVWFSSVIGMSLNILLMFVFQIVVGSLFLYFGLLNALFMLGLFVGGKAVEFAQTRYPGRAGFATLAVVETIFILSLLLLLPNTKGVSIMFFLPAFFGAGCVSGTWLPQASHVFRQRAVSDRTSSFLLWLSDSLGGALAGLPATLLLLPAVGLRGSFRLLLIGGCILLLFSTLPALLSMLARVVRCRAMLLLLPLLAALHSYADKPDLLEAAARLAPERELSLQTAKPDEQEIIYFKVEDKNNLVGYIFLSRDFAASVKGFRDHIAMLIFIDPAGRLMNFSVLESKETPSYLDHVLESKSELVGKNSRDGKVAFETDAVSGATLTAKGIVDTLNLAGKNFTAFIKDEKAPAPSIPAADPLPPPGGARDIDAAAYRRLIDSGRLSGRKAKHAHPLTDRENRPATQGVATKADAGTGGNN